MSKGGALIQYKVYANYKFILIKFHKKSIHEQILCYCALSYG